MRVPVHPGRSRPARVLLVLGLGLVLAGCQRGEGEPAPPSDFAPALGVDLGEMDQTNTGLYLQVLQEGSGDRGQAGDLVGIQYTGWLVDGTPFDSSFASTPIRLSLGEDFMPGGFMQGIAGMRMNEERLLVVKPDLGYGRELVPDVPRGSWLVYRVKRVPPPPRPI